MPLLPPPLHTHAQPGDARSPTQRPAARSTRPCSPPWSGPCSLGNSVTHLFLTWPSLRPPSLPRRPRPGPQNTLRTRGSVERDGPACRVQLRSPPPHRRLLPSCASRASLQGSGRVRLPGTGRPPHRGGSPAHPACTRTAPGNARCLSRALPGDTGVCRSERSEGEQRRPRAERTLAARRAQTRPPRAHASPLASPAGATSSHGGYEATCGWDIECHNGPSDRLGNRKLTRDGD